MTIPDARAAGAGPDETRRSPPALLLGLRRGIARSCPACGVGRLFQGYLSVLPQCPVCGNDNGQYPSDDFAPYVTIFLVLHIVTPLFIYTDHRWAMSVWLEAGLWLPIFAAITLAVLPFVKGGVIGFAWAYGVTRGR